MIDGAIAFNANCATRSYSDSGRSATSCTVIASQVATGYICHLGIDLGISRAEIIGMGNVQGLVIHSC